MKINIIFLLLFYCLLTGCGSKETVIRFHADAYNGFRPEVSVKSASWKAEMDSVKGMGQVVLSVDAPAFAVVKLGKNNSRIVYIEPGCELEIGYSCEQIDKTFTVSGDLNRENEFLNRKDFYARMPQAKPRSPFAENLQSLDSVVKVNQDRLDAERGLSAGFKKLESARLDLGAGGWLSRYFVLRDTAEYIQALRARMPEDACWMEIPGYCDFMKSAVYRLTFINSGGQTEGREKRSVDYILDHIQGPEIRAYLLDLNIMSILTVGGIAGNERYVDIYRQYVTDSVKLRQLDRVYKQYEKVAAGQPCPEFCLKDINGKEVKLADFAGKYVYIDLWATWCGPCKGEMPALATLEERFEGRDIEFVSISVDRNRDIELWKKTVADMKLGGVQLHLGENWDWLKNFMPVGMSVPRMILLDKEGKIINANMSLPSDKATAQKLEELTKA